ncbi:class I SAM-dependent methyltransferase [Candidatus Micrarchaeota archaeon]|nr:class I SAM-dependent methyltransferase [Candidatus Micrarchaeota archaeon]
MRKKTGAFNHPYFDLQAEWGITKHFNGITSSEELVRFCRINRYSYVLDVGCGVGISTCRIAKKHRCRMVGVDISKRMVERAQERAIETGIDDLATFREANAAKLPFKNNSFDAVIAESVTAFTKNKQKTLKEYARVVKKGGYVGIVESTWLQPPKPEIENYLVRTMGSLHPAYESEWKSWFKGAELTLVESRVVKMEVLKQGFAEWQLAGLLVFFRSMYRMIKLCATRPEYRKATIQLIKEAKRAPKGLTDTFGYGVYVGKKKMK